MNLTEGELIEQIEEIDEGWWSGVGAGGSKTGLFPCTFRWMSVARSEANDVFDQLTMLRSWKSSNPQKQLVLLPLLLPLPLLRHHLLP